MNDRKEKLYVLAIQNLRKQIAFHNLYGCNVNPNDEEIDYELEKNPDKYIISLNMIPTEEDIEMIKDIMLKVGYDDDTSISDVGEMFSIDTIFKNPFKI